jgi:hypothetical protein
MKSRKRSGGLSLPSLPSLPNLPNLPNFFKNKTVPLVHDYQSRKPLLQDYQEDEYHENNHKDEYHENNHKEQDSQPPPYSHAEFQGDDNATNIVPEVRKNVESNVEPNVESI